MKLVKRTFKNFFILISIIFFSTFCMLTVSQALEKSEAEELIKKISEELNCGILLISHDLHVVMSATDFVVCLNGHVCCSGTPQVVAKNNEYQELFGDRASSILSLYEHKHDHTHSQDGTIKRKE